MAIITSQASLYQSFRLVVVDKNITANLSAGFTAGNRNRPIQPVGQNEVFPNVLPQKLIRERSRMLVNSSLTLINERLKTIGAGNNVITTQGVDNTRNWKTNAALNCKFPTYFRIDLEAIGLPEGTDVVVDIEEGFAIEADYPGSPQAPLPRQLNFVSFRTPRTGHVVTASNFTMPNVAYTNFRPFSAAFTGAFTPFLSGQLNRLGVSDLQSAFQQTAIVGFRKFGGIVMNARFGPIGPGDIPYLEGNGFQFQTGLGFWPQGFPGILRIRGSDVSVETTSDANILGNIARLGTANLTATFTLNTDPVKDVVIDSTLFNNAGMAIDANILKSGQAVINSISTVQSQLNSILRLTSSMNLSSNLSSTVVRTVNPSTAMASTSTLVQSFDTILEWDTSKYFQTYSFPATAPAPRIAAFYLNNRTGPVTVIWGDGTSNVLASGDDSYIQHQYAVDGIYEIRIRGRFAIFGPNNAQATATGDSPVLLGQRLRRFNANSQLTKVKSWGEHGLTSLRLTFSHCRNLNFIPNQAIPDSAITDMRDTFSQTASAPNVGFNQPLSNLDTSLVTTMARMFADADAFNQPIGNWNTSAVTDMTAMFANARFFNQDISGWCVQNIPVKPTNFDLNGSSSWTENKKPNWGAPC